MAKNTSCNCSEPPGGGTTCPPKHVAFCRRTGGKCHGSCESIPTQNLASGTTRIYITQNMTLFGFGWFILNKSGLDLGVDVNPNVYWDSITPVIPSEMIYGLSRRLLKGVHKESGRKAVVKFTLPDTYNNVILNWNSTENYRLVFNGNDDDDLFLDGENEKLLL